MATRLWRRSTTTGRITRAADPNGVVTDYTYSPRGWLLRQAVRGPDNSTESDDAITLFEYTASGQLSAVESPDGVRLAFQYDAAQRLTRVTDETGAYVNYKLDAMGGRMVERAIDGSGTLRRRLVVGDQGLAPSRDQVIKPCGARVD
jgi:YD repeat-containing protein